MHLLGNKLVITFSACIDVVTIVSRLRTLYTLAIPSSVMESYTIIPYTVYMLVLRCPIALTIRQP